MIPVLDDLLSIYKTPKVGEHASMENMNAIGCGSQGDDGGGTMEGVEMDIDIVSTKKERELAEMGEMVGDLSELQRRVSG